MFDDKQFQQIALLERQIQLLSSINSYLEKMEKHMATNPPVSQATFDAALSDVNTALSQLLAVGQQVGAGLVKIEADLAAKSGDVDLSGELATVQNMKAQLADALQGAQTALASIPSADQPDPTPAPAA